MSRQGTLGVGRSPARLTDHADGALHGAGGISQGGAPIGLLGRAVVGGTIAFAVLIALLHGLSPDIDPVQRPTSEYAIGPFGYLMTAAFLTLSAATSALVVGLHRDLAGSARSRLGVGALAAFAVGLLVAAAFPIDLDGAPPTVAGTIHAINGPLTFLALVVGVNLVSRRLRHDARWRPVHGTVRALALLLVIEFVVGGLAAANETRAGIAQRVLLITFCAWFITVGFRLHRNATR